MQGRRFLLTSLASLWFCSTLTIMATQTATMPAAAAINQEALAEKAKASSPEQEPSIFFNFNDASLATVLGYLVDRKSLDVIPHKDLANIKVSLLSEKPMTLSEAWEAVLLQMEANGFTIINVNGVNRVVPLNTGPQNPLPCYSSLRGVEPENLPDTNALCRYIYFCKNLKVSVAQTIITPLLSDRAVQINNVLQACVITDNCNAIKAAMRIVKELDIGGMRQAIKIIALQHTDADQIAKLFNEQILDKSQQETNKIRIIGEEKKKEMSYFSKDLKIFTDTTQNRLILMGQDEAISRIITFIKKYLDVPLETTNSRIHVKELKYYNAETMKALLEKIIAPPRGQGGQTGTVEGEYKFFQDVVISSEVASAGGGTQTGGGSGNRLIVACNPEDWRRLSIFIDELDKPQPQVALEMMIVDVQIRDTKSLGAQFKVQDGLIGDSLRAGSFMAPSTGNSLSATNLVSSIGELGSNTSILSFGDASSDQIWGIIRAMYSINHSNIISQPYLVVNNNTKGTENSTVNRMVPSKLETNGSSQPVLRYVATPASVKAEITPHVNNSGIIKLEIVITVDEFKSNDASSPDKTNREIVTQASMAAGEVLVLGGLTRSKHSNSRWSVPFLSAIPIIGNLFQDKTRENQKDNLYIFIRPTIIKPHFNMGADAYTQLKLDYAKYQILNADSTALSKDPIQRYFFGPARYSPKQKALDHISGRMPIIDNYAERQNMPNEVAMTKDSYFHPVQEMQSLSYEPEEGFASMPHIKPSEYSTPGLFDELLPDDFFQALKQQMPESHLTQRSSAL